VNNQQSERVPANELVVGRCALLAALPACRVALVRIPDELAGWEFRPGRKLEAGYACGSMEQANVVEVRALANSTQDDNATRYVGLEAIHDWCWGEDAQWLESVTGDAISFSHDHGHYFPGGPNWTPQTLEAQVAVPHQLAFQAGLSAAEARRIGGVLDGLTVADVGGIVSGLPAKWNTSDEELAHLAWFLAERARGTAARLRERYPA
jgi:hypothetical protein